MQTSTATDRDGGLTEILRAMRLRTGLISRARVHAPFGIHASGPGGPIFHAVVTGQCLVRRDADPAYHALFPGDVAIVTRGDLHALYDEPHRSTAHLSTLEFTRTRSRVGLFTAPGPGVRTDILCGSFALAHAGGDALFTQLPPLLIVRAEGRSVVPWLYQTLEQLDAELDRDEPGADEVITRLVDLLVVNVLRRCFAQAGDDAPGWLCGLRDPQMGRALAAIHGDPAKEWSATSLAALVGMSRSTFFARFTELVGEPPASYLAQWRMKIAVDLMADPALSMGQLAERVGYGSEHAFGKVFKRVMGVPPGEYRRQRRGASAH